MNRKDIIFCKMLQYESIPLGSYEAPVAVTEDVLKMALRNGSPAIMKDIKSWLHETDENRMALFTNKFGHSWAVMRTNRVSLTKERTVDWVKAKSEPKQWLQETLNPIWVTVYRQTE